MVDLSDRQLEVVRLIAEGKSGKQIARALGISRRTVETHIYRIARKLPPGPSPRLRIMVYYYHHLHQSPGDV